MRQLFGVFNSLYLFIFQILVIEFNIETVVMLMFNLAGHVNAAKVLIEHGSNVNAEDKFNLTPLLFVSQNGDYLNVRDLNACVLSIRHLVIYSL